eukprot:TRINITY_DN16864_c0_g2_i3.p1 TRINITY_DN16864_c0_g2~~TRINITY_DN16864_c0_g2_i3.p1  ORF type:complete len:1333 (-),score=249.67 TRINITY_DN16864_c0_g2_i3:117-4046(-)
MATSRRPSATAESSSSGSTRRGSASLKAMKSGLLNRQESLERPTRPDFSRKSSDGIAEDDLEAPGVARDILEHMEGVTATASCQEARDAYHKTMDHRHVYSKAKVTYKRMSSNTEQKLGAADRFRAAEDSVLHGLRAVRLQHQVLDVCWHVSNVKKFRAELKRVARQHVMMPDWAFTQRSLQVLEAEVQTLEEHHVELDDFKRELGEMVGAIAEVNKMEGMATKLIPVLTGSSANVEDDEEAVLGTMLDAKKLASKARGVLGHLQNIIGNLVMKREEDFSEERERDALQLLDSLPEHFAEELVEEMTESPNGPDDPELGASAVARIVTLGATESEAEIILEVLKGAAWDTLRRSAVERDVLAKTLKEVDETVDQIERLMEARGPGSKEIKEATPPPEASAETDPSEIADQASNSESRKSALSTAKEKLRNALVPISVAVRMSSGKQAEEPKEELGHRAPSKQDTDDKTATAVPDSFGLDATPAAPREEPSTTEATSDESAQKGGSIKQLLIASRLKGLAHSRKAALAELRERKEHMKLLSSPRAAAPKMNLVFDSDDERTLDKLLKDLKHRTCSHWNTIEDASTYLSSCGGDVGGDGRISVSTFQSHLQDSGYRFSCAEVCVLFRAVGIAGCGQHSTVSVIEFARLDEVDVEGKAPQSSLDKASVKLFCSLIRDLQMQRIGISAMGFEECLLAEVHVARIRACASADDQDDLFAALNTLNDALPDTPLLAPLLLSRRGLRVLMAAVVHPSLSDALRDLAAVSVAQAMDTVNEAYFPKTVKTQHRTPAVGTSRKNIFQSSSTTLPKMSPATSKRELRRVSADEAHAHASRTSSNKGEHADDEVSPSAWPDSIIAMFAQELWIPLFAMLDSEGGEAETKPSASLYGRLVKLLKQARIPELVAGDCGVELGPKVIEILEILANSPPSKATLESVVSAFDLLERSRDAMEESSSTKLIAVAVALGGCRVLREYLSAVRTACGENTTLRWGARLLRSWEAQRFRMLGYIRQHAARRRALFKARPEKQEHESESDFFSVPSLESLIQDAGYNARAFLQRIEALAQSISRTRAEGLSIPWPVPKKLIEKKEANDAAQEAQSEQPAVKNHEDNARDEAEDEGKQQQQEEGVQEDDVTPPMLPAEQLPSAPVPPSWPLQPPGGGNPRRGRFGRKRPLGLAIGCSMPAPAVNGPTARQRPLLPLWLLPPGMALPMDEQDSVAVEQEVARRLLQRDAAALAPETLGIAEAAFAREEPPLSAGAAAADRAARADCVGASAACSCAAAAQPAMLLKAPAGAKTSCGAPRRRRHVLPQRWRVE